MSTTLLLFDIVVILFEMPQDNTRILKLFTILDTVRGFILPLLILWLVYATSSVRFKWLRTAALLAPLFSVVAPIYSYVDIYGITTPINTLIITKYVWAHIMLFTYAFAVTIFIARQIPKNIAAGKLLAYTASSVDALKAEIIATWRSRKWLFFLIPTVIIFTRLIEGRIINWTDFLKELLIILTTFLVITFIVYIINKIQKQYETTLTKNGVYLSTGQVMPWTNVKQVFAHPDLTAIELFETNGSIFIYCPRSYQKVLAIVKKHTKVKIN